VSSFLIHLLTLVCLYAMMALGLNLQAGYAGMVNFGFIAFAGLGAYAAGIASQLGWPLPAALLLALGSAVSSRPTTGASRRSRSRRFCARSLSTSRG
jgi:branched-chain amino acid transport system permease protein